MLAYIKKNMCLYTEGQNCDVTLKQQRILTEWDSKDASEDGEAFFRGIFFAYHQHLSACKNYV